MALPTNRTEFKDFILKRLGAPVIKVDVTDDQIENIIDMALDFFAEYHYAGSEKVYHAHQITDTDRTNRYIQIPDEIFSITNILKLDTYFLGVGMFNVKYQWALNNAHNIAHDSLQPFWFSMQEVEFEDQILNHAIPIRFQKHTNRLYLDTDWNGIDVGTYIVAEGYKRIDPNVYPDVWKDRFMINYTTALVKKQWGQNLIKFDQIQLPGGVTLNGRQLYDDADAEIQQLEGEMINSYGSLIDMVIG